MLKERLNKKVMLIAFLLILFLAIPSSFAGDSSAMDIADNSSFNDNLAISSADSQVLDDSSGSIGNGNDAILNEENGNLDDSSNSNSMDDSNLDTSNDYKKSNLGSNKISDGTIWANDDLETSYGSLAEAIANAQSGNTIVCIEPTTETLNNITINKNLTIKALNLGDAILKSNGKNVFYLNRGYTLNLINLTFDDYSTDMQVRGAAVYGYGDMYVENCKFSNLRTSTSISYGGVIYSDDYSKITIINSTFDNIVTCIGVAHVSRGNLDIINSSFNKIYSYGYGGAVYSWGSEVSVNNCKFENSSFSEPMIFVTQTELNVKDSLFKNITSSDETSSIYVTNGASAYIENTVFDSCKSTFAPSTSGSKVGAGVVYGAGSAEYVSILKSTFINCRETDYYNSNYSYYGTAGAVFLNCSGDVNHCIFLNNSVNEKSKNGYEDILALGDVNADFNYWGTNSGPTDSMINTDIVTVDNWYVLSLDLDENPIAGHYKDITFDLLLVKNATGDLISSIPLQDFNFTIIPTLSNNDSFELSIIDGYGTINYISQDSGTETLKVINIPDEFEFSVDADPLSSIYVSEDGSDSNNGDLDHPYKTIEHALSQVSETRNILYINAGRYNESNLKANKSVTIVGLGDVVIDAKENGRLFIVEDDINLQIRDLTLMNGKSNDDGGAIYLANGNLTLNNVTIRNSTANNGGAIAIESIATIIDSKFIGNKALNDGGAIIVNTDAAIGMKSIIFNSNFVNNSANNGGAIAIYGPIVLNSSEIESNLANANGGAVFADNANNSDIILDGNTLIENRAVNGGAFYLSNSAIKNISAINNIFIENTATGYGGAIDLKDVSVYLKNNNMGGNEALTDGDKIYLDNSFINNGVLTYLSGQTVNVTLGQTIVLNASVSDDLGNEICGGTISFKINTDSIGTSNVIAGFANMEYAVEEATSSDLRVWGNYSGFKNNYELNRGFIHVISPNWFIENGGAYEYLATAIANANEGDVIYGNPGTYNITRIVIDKDITIKALEKNTVFLKGNYTQIFNITKGASVNLINLTLSNGASSGYGGLLEAQGELNIINCTLRDNAMSGSYSQGGAIYLWNESKLNIFNSEFRNISSYNGGAIYVYKTTSELNVIDSIFDNISCRGNGSAIYSMSSVVINGSNFTNINGPYYYGSTSNNYAAVYVGNHLDVYNSRFINITGPKASVIRLDDEYGVLNISHSVFANNYGSNTTIWSIGMYNYINYCIFANNTGESGNYWDFIATGYYLVESDLNYNYWESNEGPYYNFNDNLVTLDNWVVLELSADENMLVAGSSNPIHVDFNRYTDGENYFTLSESMPDYTFDLTASTGTIDSTVEVQNGVGTANYIAPDENSHVVIYIELGDETLEFDVMQTQSLIYVSTDGSDISGLGTISRPYATIAYALTKVNDTKNIIYLADGVYNESNLNITKTVTIQGQSINNTIINARKQGEIFNIKTEGIDVIINSLTLSNGKSANGGAIFADAGNLTLFDTVISSSSATDGGVIYLDTDATLYNNVFKDISDESNAVIYLNSGNLILNNNTMENNPITAIHVNEGTVNAVISYLNNATVNLPRSSRTSLNVTVKDDKGNLIDGGDIEFIINGEILGSVNVENGFAIIDYSVPSTEGLYKVNGTYSNQNANATIKSGIVRSYKIGWYIGENGFETLEQAINASKNGDTIIGIPGTYNVTYNQIYKDITIKANESGTVVLHLSGRYFAEIGDGNTVNFEGLVVENAKGYGGYFIEGQSSIINIDNCTYRNAETSYHRGVIDISNCELNIRNSNFHGIHVSESGSSNYGGGISATNSRVYIENSTFKNNVGGSYGAAICLSGSHLTLINSNFYNNTASFRGGAIYGGSYSTLNATNCSFINNSAPSYGGAISIESGEVNVTHSVFMDNHGASRGGAIYVARNSTFNYNIFLNNTCDNANEGIDVYFQWYNYTYPDEFVNADYNYWGSNDGPGNKVSGNVTVNNWVLLEGALNESNVTLGINYAVNINLTRYVNDLGVISRLREKMPDLNLDVSAILGELNTDKVKVADGTASFIYSPVSIGEETISLLPMGDVIKFNVSFGADYILVSNVTEITVDLRESSVVSISVLDKFRELSDDLDGKDINISYTVGENTYSITKKVVGSYVTFNLNELDNLQAGQSARITVSTVDVENVDSAIINVNVNKLETSFIVYDLEAIEGSALLDATLLSSEGILVDKQVQIIVETINGNKTYSAFTNSRGIAHFVLNDLTVGEYNAILSYGGDDLCRPSTTELKITINEAIVNISASDLEIVKGSGSLEVQLTLNGEALSGKTINANVGGINMSATTNSNGFATFDLSNLGVGTYTASISFNDDEASYKANANVSITVYPEGSVVINHTGDDAKDIQAAIDAANPGDTIQLGKYNYTNVSDINVTKDLTILGDGTSITSAGNGNPIFNVPSIANGGPNEVNMTNISFKVNNGDVIISANADNGTNPLSIDTAAISFVSNMVTLANDDVVAESVTVLELNSERGILSPSNDITVSDNIFIVGINPFEFIVSSFNEGSQTIVPIGGNLGEKLATVIEYEDMETTAIDSSIEPGTGKYFQITLRDSNGVALANKAVQFGFNGKIYNKTTNDQGVAELQINLQRADIYTFAVSFQGDDAYNGSFAVAKITVKKQTPSLTVPNKSYKASAKTKILTATFKSASGKVVANKKVTFTVNGKTYTSTTNDKGVASVNVSLSNKKTYSFTAKFAGDNTYAAITKTAKITIK